MQVKDDGDLDQGGNVYTDGEKRPDPGRILKADLVGLLTDCMLGGVKEELEMANNREPRAMGVLCWDLRFVTCPHVMDPQDRQPTPAQLDADQLAGPGVL